MHLSTCFQVGMMIQQVTEGVNNIGKFQSIVKLTAFSPFKSGVNALENINAISEGIVHEDLKNFLEVSFKRMGGKLIYI